MKRILTFLFLFSSLFASSQTQFLGAPNTTVVVKGNMKVDSILYLPKRQKTPTDTGALRYQISDSSLYVWTGNAWRKAKNDGTITSVSAGTGMSFTTITSTGSVSADTNVLSTKSWRQKGDDSLGAIIATKGTVTSVGLTMPSAFAVANSPVTTSGTLAVTATGSATEYIRGDGTLGTLPTSGGGGGSGVNYYLNGSVSQGTIGGSTYYEMSKTPIVGTGKNFTAAADGLMQQFITDAGDPNRLLVPAGAWNFELYFSASSAGGTPTFYVELLKYDGTTFTSIASSSASPQAISNGTIKTLYFTSLAVSETVLTATDRLAIRVYVNVSGRTITFYTEDANLAEIITTFAGGVVSLNGLTANDQFFATGTTGTNFNISSTSATHTFNLPTASATNRGALSSTDWSTFNNKVNISDTAAMLTPYLRKVDTATLSNRINLKLNISDTSSMLSPYARTATVNASIATKVNISDTSTMLTPYLRKVDTTAMLSPYYRTAAATAALALKVNISDTSSMLTNYIRHGGYGLTKTGQALSVDTSAIATRARVQKAVDSLQANINAKGSGTVTSVATGYGINGGTITTTGTLTADTLNLSTRAWRQKGIDSLGLVKQNVITNPVTGTGTNNYVSKWSGASTQTISQIFDNGTNVGINNASPNAKLEITGTSNILKLNTTAGGGYNLQLSTNFVDGTTYAMNPYISGVNNGGFELLNVTSNRKELVIFPGTGNFSINNSTDAGYKFDIAGILRNTAAAYFATTTGNVGIGNTLPSEKLHVTGRIRATTIDSTASPINLLTSDVSGVIRKTSIGAAGGIGGTGITGYFPKWTGANTQDTSQLFQVGGNIGIGTATPGTNKLFVNGNTRVNGDLNVTTGQLTAQGSSIVNMTAYEINVIGGVSSYVKIEYIDSTATARNMLYQDANGRIKKSAVPTGGSGTVTSVATGFGLSGGTITTTGTLTSDTASMATRARVQKGIDSVAALTAGSFVDSVKMRNSTLTGETNFTFAKETTDGTSINQVIKHIDLTGNETVVVNIASYVLTSNFTTGTWTSMAVLPVGFRPTHTLFFPLVPFVEADSYETAANTNFTGQVKLSGYLSMRITNAGEVEVYVQTVSESAQFSGSNNSLIFPVSVAFAILPILN